MKIHDPEGLKAALAELRDGGSAQAPVTAAAVRWRRAGPFLAAATLTASLAVHVATFVPGAHVSMQVAWPLHVLALASFGLGLGQLLRRRPTPSPHPVRISEVVRELHATRQHLLKDFPPLAMLGLGGLLAYTFLNFFLSVLQLPGSPDSAGNEFVLMNKGQVIRVITETEFRHLQSVETRGFSGHWMLFSAAGLGFFSLRSHKAPNHQPGQDGA